MIPEILITALIAVESGGRDDAIGDSGHAFGCLQIHSRVVTDVNRISGLQMRHEDVFNRAVAIETAKIYLSYYATKSGQKITPELLARIWNGGPDGWRKPSTKRYWRKVQHYIVMEAAKWGAFFRDGAGGHDPQPPAP